MNISGASRNVRIITSSISIIVMLWLFLYERYGPTFRESFLEDSSQKVFQGRVDSIYNDVPNHNTRTSLLSFGYKLELWTKWQSKISLGDSLVKKQNSLKIEVYKYDGKKIDLDYIEIANGFRKDLQ